MRSYIVTVSDILESAEKYGKDNIFTYDLKEIKDNKQNNKSKFDCTWIPLKFKKKDGTTNRLKLEIKDVLIASGAKIPNLTGEENIKNLFIAFRKFTLEEILSGDYAPKQKDNQDEQKRENERAKRFAIKLLESTNAFNDAMEIIDLSYEKVCKELKNTANLPFNIKKDKKMKDIPIFSIRQLFTDDKDTNEEKALDNPLTRIKLLVNKNGIIGINKYNNVSKTLEFKPNVFDAIKSFKTNNRVLATVKEGKKQSMLSVSNANEFITFKSIIKVGVIELSEITSSRFGLSLKNSFEDIVVRKHSIKTYESFNINELNKAFEDDDVNEINSDNDNKSSDEDLTSSDEVSENKKSEEVEESEEDDEEFIEVMKKSSKKKENKKVKKVVEKKVKKEKLLKVEDDLEQEDDDNLSDEDDDFDDE